MFLLTAISGICPGIFWGSSGSHRAAPGPMCLPTMTQVGCEHTTQCFSLVHADMLCIAPQRWTMQEYKYVCGTYILNQLLTCWFFRVFNEANKMVFLKWSWMQMFTVLIWLEFCKVKVQKYMLFSVVHVLLRFSACSFVQVHMKANMNGMLV